MIYNIDNFLLRNGIRWQIVGPPHTHKLSSKYYAYNVLFRFPFIHIASYKLQHRQIPLEKGTLTLLAVSAGRDWVGLWASLGPHVLCLSSGPAVSNINGTFLGSVYYHQSESHKLTSHLVINLLAHQYQTLTFPSSEPCVQLHVHQ